jgi:hypothetical protein
MTHYRQKGFTYDPETMPEYLSLLDQLSSDPEKHRLPQAQVDLAWAYAYRFFFEYPFPFPWHLIHFWDDIETRSMKTVLEDHEIKYQPTIDALLGGSIHWNSHK